MWLGFAIGRYLEHATFLCTFSDPGPSWAFHIQVVLSNASSRIFLPKQLYSVCVCRRCDVCDKWRSLDRIYSLVFEDYWIQSPNFKICCAHPWSSWLLLATFTSNFQLLFEARSSSRSKPHWSDCWSSYKDTRGHNFSVPFSCRR